MDEKVPKYLYKVISLEDWRASIAKKIVKLPPLDKEFIHFSMEEQLEKTITKFWKGVQQYVVLKIDTKKLPGRMKFETNPGGENKYYHLYEGFIPLESIAESKEIRK